MLTKPLARRIVPRVHLRGARFAVLGAWIVVLVALVPFGQKLDDATTDEYVLRASSQTERVQSILRDRFPGGDQRTVVVAYRRAGGLTAADKQRIAADAGKAARVENVGRPVPAFAPGAPKELVSPNGEVALSLYPLVAQKVFHITPTLDALREIDAGGGGLQVAVTGYPALTTDITEAVKGADTKLLLGTAVLVLLLLIAVYRSPLLAILPLLVVGVAYAITTGIIYLLHDAIGLAIDTTSRSLLLVLMFGAGTDYCLLLVGRYRAALSTTPNIHDAIHHAVHEAAPAILASGFTVIGALLAMLLGQFGILRTLGPIDAIGVAVVLLASLTLLPVLLTLVGRAAFWPRKSIAAHEGVGEHAFWLRVGEAVRRRPAAWLAVFFVLLGIGAAGYTQRHVDVSPIRQFRQSADSVDGYKIISAAFPRGAANPTTVLVDRASGRLAPADVAAVQRRIAATPGVAAVQPTGRVSRDGRATTLTLVFADDPFLSPALDRVEQIRAEFPESAGGGVRVLLGQGSAERLDYQDGLERDAKVIIPAVLFVVFLALVILLRALVAPLFLLVTVVLSFAGSLGASMFLFNHVFHQSVDPLVPLLIFIFLVALGADYNIFLMSRVREESFMFGTREGMLRALTATGPVITSAGIILGGTFAVLTTLPLWLLFDVGFAVAFGILVDTFIVRSLCVSALTWLVGRHSWWPLSVPREIEDGRATDA